MKRMMILWNKIYSFYESNQPSFAKIEERIDDQKKKMSFVSS